MQSKIALVSAELQPRAAQPVAPKSTKRRRVASISRGALDTLDAAVESLGTTEEPSRDWQLIRAETQDLFAARTRKLLRKLEGELRSLRAQIDGRRAA